MQRSLAQWPEAAAARRCRWTPLDDSRLLEMFEPLAQDVGRDAFAGIEQLPKTRAAEQEVAHDQKAPFVADAIERAGKRTV